MKTRDINIRDPFILVDGGKYYMYGSRGASCWGNTENPDCGFDVYISDDLENWSEPICIFEKLDGTLTFTCHQPNKNPLERPQFVAIAEREDSLFVI
ncbi:MAG: hypothetical protein IJ428_00560 [Clostridia bacterium]|nr:hypothetical protein [Clostridia bacterium]